MPRQIVYENVYADSGTERLISSGELALIERTVREARRNMAFALQDMAKVARAVQQPGGSLDSLGRALKVSFNEAFQLGREPDANRRQSLVRQIEAKFIRLEREMRGNLEIHDLPKRYWNANLRGYTRDATRENITRFGSCTVVREITPLGVAGFVRRRESQRRIYLCFPYLFSAGRMGRILIHEASHLFLKTKDHAYSSNGISWVRGLPTPQEAVENADSYAMIAARPRTRQECE